MCTLRSYNYTIKGEDEFRIEQNDIRMVRWMHI